MSPTGVSGTWNETQHHHMDAVLSEYHGTGIVAVDGQSSSTGWKIGIMTPTTKRRGVRGTYMSSDQTGISGDGSANVISFDTEYHDIGSGSGVDRYTARESGVYELKAMVTLKSLPASAFTPELRLNTIDSFEVIAWPEVYVPSGASTNTIEASGQVYLPEGETVAAAIIQDSGSDITAEGGREKTHLEGKPIW